MTKQIDFQKYNEFVDAVTSDESRDFIALSDRLVSLDQKGANIERLLTGAVGINSEGGEIMEIVTFGHWDPMSLEGGRFSEVNIREN